MKWSLLVLLFVVGVTAQESKLTPARAPSFATAAPKYLAGELVIVDAVNRRGALRLDGDGPLHYFTMLPYGAIGYHGAPAEFRDVPLGTHLHGYFHLPPPGEEETIPPHQRGEKHNHAFSLEDDFTYYQRRGQSWKIAAVDLRKGKLDVEPAGTLVKDDVRVAHTFDIDDVTEVWKGRTLVDLDQLTPGQTVQLNLTWCQGSRDREFLVRELWLDDDARKFAAEQQRLRHVKYQRERWLPGWIDEVELFDYGGAIITITLFGGMDPALYEDMKAGREVGYWVATAEKTLRTWNHRSDRKVGKVLEWSEVPNPPPGSSGIRLKLKFAEVLEGYKPGRCVRLKCEKWAFITMPFEERVKSVEEQKRSAVMTLP